MSSGPSDRGRLPEDWLSAFVDDELSAADRAAVDARLEADATWRHILDDVTAARDAVRALPEREAPSGFWLRVLTHVAEVAEQDRSTIAAAAAVVPIAPAPARRATRWGAVAAAAAAIAVGVAVAAPQGDGRVEPNVVELADDHAAATSTQNDPVSNLAPAAVPAQFAP
jgi:anti-sigma factor RsiW